MKAPEFLHLTFKEQKDSIYDAATDSYTSQLKTPLGFAHAYEPKKKAFEGKRLTQLMWAYGNSWDANSWEERDDGIYKIDFEWRLLPVTGHRPEYERAVTSKSRFADYLQPRVIKNEPMTGFKISKSVSRASTSNKLIRIEDPRGFELEIAVANLVALLETGTVTKNEFIGAMQWQTGKILKWVDHV